MVKIKHIQGKWFSGILLLLCCLSLQPSMAQVKAKYLKKYRVNEFAFHLGATNLIGELGGANRIGSEAFSLRDFDFPSIRPTVGVGLGYQVMERGNLKTNLIMGFMRGNDRFTEYPSRKQRNINYRSMLLELSEQFEYYITLGKQTRKIYNMGEQRKKISLKNFPFTFYAFAGIGGFYFQPQNRDQNGKWWNVKPLHTEGQGEVPSRKNYSLVQISIPMGLGIKYPLGKGYTLGFEYGYRKTFTDYLDDASMTYFDEEYLRQHYGDMAVYLSNPSGKDYIRAGQQRGDPRDDDFYLFALVTLYYDLSKVARIRNFRF